MDGIKQHPYNLPENAVWFITGCSSGIGKALAELVVSKGQRVVATARKPSTLSYLPDNDPNILKLPLDVSSPRSIDAAVASALSHFHRLDVVVNNAGYALYGDTENAPPAMARQLIETNFWGTVALTQHAMRIMRDENSPQGGVVMNVSSMGGRVAFQGHAFYHASKFAVEGFTESVAKEVLPEWNVHFCLIEPGGVKTGYVDKGMVSIPNHPAYGDDAPTRVLERYMKDPVASSGWADVEGVVKEMYEVVGKGGEIPLRVPLGEDAWMTLKMENERRARELEGGRERAVRAGKEGQAESLAFLTK